MCRIKGFGILVLLLCSISYVNAQTTKKPNVIVIITDDQGYGDLGCTGNPIVKTPALDKFHKKSVRLTDFHVGPTCAPSRSGLMTGRYCNRTGVWHTIGGVSILRQEETTMAQVFQQNGYKTAMFGKWHLGDTYPARPQDKGFDYTLIHGGGGVGQTPDYWGNDYFDDTYLENGTPKKVLGYCTDVWFNEAINYIKSKKDEPFFCYISTNAPHSPYNVPEEYYKPYAKLDIPEFQKRFYGMITNVDHNFKKLQKILKDLKIADNTILIFMTDNGTAAGYKKVDGKLYGFNAGMKGTKNSEYDGGHRVPFLISYPNGNIDGGRDVTDLTAHIDIFPTLAQICNLNMPELAIDGTDISGLLQDKKDATLTRDYVITDSQRMQHPTKWHKSAVMSNKWRLVNGTELYNISTDPGQEKNLAQQNPQKVVAMRGYYEQWWASVSTEFNQFPVIIVGSEKQNPIEITCHDGHIHDSKIPWNQNFIRESKKNPYGSFFTLQFEETGTYEVELSRWPFESGLTINEGISNGTEATETTEAISLGRAMNFKSATLQIGGWEQQMKVEAQDKVILFTGVFAKGKTNMSAWFTDNENTNWGAFYIRFTKK